MLTDAVIQISTNDPSVGYLLLKGMNTIGNQRLDFTVSEEPKSRKEAVDRASDCLCPLAAAFLNMPYFKGVSVFSIKNTDCLALVLQDGRKWNDAIGDKSTLHSFLPQLVMKNYQKMTVVIGKNESVDLEKLQGSMESFVRLHPLQDIVKKDEGTLAFDKFDPATGTLTLQFGGKCASSTTCVGSQISSRNWISRDTKIEFPNHIRQIRFS